MTACAAHQPFLAAVADEELELVPGPTLEHLAGCADCREEVDAHRVLAARLSEALAAEPVGGARTGGGRRGWRRLALAGAALAALGGAGAGGLTAAHEQAVATAIAAGSADAQFRSADPTAIRAWCRRGSGHEIPDVPAGELLPEGARMDAAAGGDVVTVLYRDQAGRRVAVSWLSWPGGLGAAAWGSSVTREVAGGRPALVVALGGGRAAVVTGPGAEAWELAARLEAQGRGR